MSDDTSQFYIAHGFCFSKEPRYTAENVFDSLAIHLGRVPYIYNLLPASVAAHTGISPLAKVLYADRLSFLRMARKHHKTSQENGNPSKFEIPYCSWGRLSSRLWSCKSKLIAAARQLENAGLMTINKSTASTYGCNTFEPLFYNDPSIECFDEEPPKKIPENGTPWTEALLRHIRFLPLLVPIASFPSEKSRPEHDLWRFLKRGTSKESITNVLVYALLIKTAKPCCYLSTKEMARQLGMSRRTVLKSIVALACNGLVTAGKYMNSRVYAILEHPYMEDNDVKRQAECKKLEAKIADGGLFGQHADAGEDGDAGLTVDAEDNGFNEE